MSVIAWSNVSSAVERNRIDREPRHDLSSWADCRESCPSPTQMWRTAAVRTAAVRSHWSDLWQLLAHSDIQISWVLSVFILSLFDCIQPSISSMHSENCRAATDDSEAGTLRCTCVSSAYECATSPFLLMTSNSSAVYSRKRRGPRTEPGGTPKSNQLMDVNWPIYSTCWVRPTRNILIHSIKHATADTKSDLQPIQKDSMIHRVLLLLFIIRWLVSHHNINRN